MRSNLWLLTGVTLLLVLLGGFAWLTHHPDAEIVRRAEDWPLVGPLASAFRDAYLGPGEVEVREDESESEIVLLPPPLSAPTDAHEFVWVLPGMKLRAEPSHTSRTILQFDALANVPMLEKRGDWYRVWPRGGQGWVYLENYDPDRDTPFGSEPEPPRPLPPREPDPETLAAARELLGDRERRTDLGPYPLYTDCRDAALVATLDRVVAELEGAYVERYRRSPLGTPLAAVVLYEREEDYRRLQARSDRLAGLPSTGHAAGGLAAVFRGRRSRQEVVSTLVHEIVHLINRRALGPALPPWLDEGMANDLAWSRTDANGRILPGSLAWEHWESPILPGHLTVAGPLASLWQLRDGLGGGAVGPVEELLSLNWGEFVRSDRSALHYAASTFWIRYLLEAEGGRQAEGFRAFLAAVAEGQPATGEALRRHLDRDWGLLNVTFRGWVSLQVDRYPARDGAPAVQPPS